VPGPALSEPPHRVDFWSYHSVKVVPDRAMTRGDVRRLLALPSTLREQIVVDAALMRVRAS